MPKTITVAQYAKRYKVAPKTVYRWIEEKRLKSFIITVPQFYVEDRKIEKKPRYKLPPRYKK
jgi:predicted site-specific integrase-resolvase